jgi:putative DNA primase/helicase
VERLHIHIRHRSLQRQGEREPYPPTDMGNSKRLLSLYEDKLLYHNEMKKWLVWKGTHWQVDNVQEVMLMAQKTIEKISEEINWLRDAEGKKELKKHQTRSESSPRLKAMLNQTEPKLSISPDQINSDPWLLNCLNGTLDLKNRTLQPHRPSDWITQIAPVKFDPKARCPNWEKFLNRIMDGNEDLVNYLATVIGYGLTGSQKEQKLFLLIGEGANGKTTFLETIREVLGDYARATPFQTFLRQTSNAIRNDIARLKGARFVTATEPERGARLSESVVKILTGEDKQTVRFLYHEFFEFQGTFKVFLAANYKPRIEGKDYGIWRRIQIIPFNVRIPENEQDKDLKEKLLKEKEGILNWAFKGLSKWNSEGLGTLPEIDEAMNEYKKDMDPVGDFLEECCILEEDQRVQSKDLFMAYRKWCKDNGERPISQKALGIDLKRRGFERRKGKPAVYLGIGISENS